MENLPEDILIDVFRRLSNAHDIAWLDRTCHRLHSVRNSSEILMPVPYPHNKPKLDVTSEENVHTLKTTLDSVHWRSKVHTVCCHKCGQLIGVPLEAIVFSHKCRLFNFKGNVVTFSNERCAIFTGFTDDLLAPIACPDDFLRFWKVTKPKAAPYTTT